MYRIGTGYDLHLLETGRRLVLGGVDIPFEKGLAGHSDADVLLHAVTDALLGAVSLGNIGALFPDTDPAFKDADSADLLREAYARVGDAGYAVVNVDATIIMEQPKLNPYIEEIQESIAGLLYIEDSDVSLKPKTNEGVGPEGQGEAISCHAVVLVGRLDRHAGT